MGGDSPSPRATSTSRYGRYAAAGSSSDQAASDHRRPSPVNLPSVSSSATQRGAASSRAEDERLLFERQNDDRLDELRSKVTSLKAVTIDIGHEVREQNRFLDTMTERGRSYICYAMLFVLLVFTLIYLLFLR